MNKTPQIPRAFFPCFTDGCSYFTAENLYLDTKIGRWFCAECLNVENSAPSLDTFLRDASVELADIL